MFKKINILLTIVFLAIGFVSVEEIININYKTLQNNDLDIDCYLSLEESSFNSDYENFNRIDYLGNVNMKYYNLFINYKILSSRLNNCNFTNNKSINFVIYHFSKVNFNNRNVKFLFNKENYLENICSYNPIFNYVFSLNKINNDSYMNVNKLVIYNFINNHENSICNFYNLSVIKFNIVSISLTFEFSLIIFCNQLLSQNFYLSVFSKIYHSFVNLAVFSYLNNKNTFESSDLMILELFNPPINLMFR
ncbi:hypothetical protein [uncultured Methanobrevibacter sp.]|uniref:hypothetical protein n=1 Tax=uncultured Methanobrevibacter sp. TaxID=253161 RepID=UPI002611CF14|nr:hypothetical protein [uncultured Methanobrevibacter sp.]